MGQFKDLTGERFGRWTVQGIGERKSNRVAWICKCDCGNVKTILTNSLTSGKSKSCGCLDDELKRSRFKDITGERFGKLTVLGPDSSKHSAQYKYWICKCDCGNYTVVSGVSLRGGNTKSCGCLHLDQLAAIDRTSISHVKHGGCMDAENVERLYNVWKGMRRRCYQKSSKAYRYYGARGISVYDEWRNNYAAFRAWAIENGYDPEAPRGKCTIDRIDNNGNYEPSNCRFVSMKVQNMNKRKKGTALRSEK